MKDTLVNIPMQFTIANFIKVPENYTLDVPLTKTQNKPFNLEENPKTILMKIKPKKKEKKQGSLNTENSPPPPP